MSTVDPSGARAAVLARLWGAAAREPLPAIANRSTSGTTLTITTHSGHTLAGPRDAAALFPAGTAQAITVTPPGRRPATVTEPAELAGLLATGHPHADRLARELTDSVRGLHTARTAATAHPRPGELWTTARDHHPDPSVYFEQLVVDGHPVHPLCRARDGIDAAAYAPEHHPRVRLPLHPVEPAHHTGDWPWHDEAGRVLLPVHPLQAQRHRPPQQAAGAVTAAPLMSLRTLAPHGDPGIHIKTALDIQMTSARRRVSPAAIHNGPRLSRAVAGLGEVLVQRETAAAAHAPDGRPSPHLAAIVRQSAAAVLPPGHIAVPLAALAEPDPATGRPLIATVIDTTGHDPHTWWHTCVRTLLPPLLRLATLGIGLEAHGQNTLLAVHNGTPTAAVYRDFGGVRVLGSTAARLGLDPLCGDLTTTDPTVIHTKLIAAAYTITLSQLVAALSRHYRTDEAPWWKPVAQTTAEHTRDDPGLREALFAGTWPVKATTAMRLADDPTADLWTPVPNPIAGQG